MKTLGNFLWIILGGLLWSIMLFYAGLVFCISIVGIPLGIQMFKMARFVLLPFGKKVVTRNTSAYKMFLNALWVVFFGWEIALMFLLEGIVFCVTIIGIPFGKQYFKLSKFILLPLGQDFA